MSTITCRTVAVGICILSFLALGTGNVAFGIILQPGDPQPGFPNFTFTFDEQGNNLLQSTAIPSGPVPVAPAPGGGIEFILPVPVVPGVVVVNGPSDVGPNNMAGFSDMLTFDNQGNNGLLIYQSLLDDPSTDLADVAGLIALATQYVIQENGPEGNNGFQWTPVPVGLTVYNGISDIPEPSTFVLATLGVGALALFARRQRKLAA